MDNIESFNVKVMFLIVLFLYPIVHLSKVQHDIYGCSINGKREQKRINI